MPHISSTFAMKDTQVGPVLAPRGKGSSKALKAIATYSRTPAKKKKFKCDVPRHR